MYLDRCSMPCCGEHGFLEHESCPKNLLCLLDDVIRRFDEGLRVEVCRLDFSKAFDSVHHRHLLLELPGLGIGGSLVKWVGEFTHGRNFYVQVGGGSSDRKWPLVKCPVAWNSSHRCLCCS